MSLLPIDLQTMFMHMDNVSKDQAAVKNAILNSQDLQAHEIVKQTEHKDNAVNETKDVEDGVDKVKEEEKKQSRRRNDNRNDKQAEEEIKEKEILKDPALGHHIDITG